MEIPIKMDDLGAPIFLETPIFTLKHALTKYRLIPHTNNEKNLFTASGITAKHHGTLVNDSICQQLPWWWGKRIF